MLNKMEVEKVDIDFHTAYYDLEYKNSKEYKEKNARDNELVNSTEARLLRQRGHEWLKGNLWWKIEGINSKPK